jgi:uncharacterized protein (TIGR02145 family)
MKNLFLFIILVTSFEAFSQVGIGTNDPHSSAMLDITSTTQGFLPPRMTAAQRAAIVAPVAGLEIWCIDCGATAPYGEAQIYNGVTWTNLVGGTIKSVTVSGTNTITGAISPIGIGTNSPEASAALEVRSTNKGFLIPRMNSTKRNSMEPASTAAGLQVWCIDCNAGAGELSIFNGEQWTTSSGTTANLAPPFGGRAICDETRPTVVKEVVSSTGKTWMDRNLGASRAATATNDYFSYGCYYQWGRGNDGHASVTANSSTSLTAVNGYTTLNSPTDTPGNNLFIFGGNGPYGSPPQMDWRATANNNLWNGVDGINNPCPSGFRLPTNTELLAEVSVNRVTIGGNLVYTRQTVFETVLKLPTGGARFNSLTSQTFTGLTGTLLGRYWTSTPGTTANSKTLDVKDSSGAFIDQSRYSGFLVRCIKN